MIGLILGLVHASYVYRLIASDVRRSGAPDQARGLYYAVWTLGLWILFGSYVLILWLAGAACYAGLKIYRQWT